MARQLVVIGAAGDGPLYGYEPMTFDEAPRRSEPDDEDMEIAKVVTDALRAYRRGKDSRRAKDVLPERGGPVIAPDSRHGFDFDAMFGMRPPEPMAADTSVKPNSRDDFAAIFGSAH